MPHPKVQLAADGSLLLNAGSYGGEVEVAAVSGDCSRVLTVRSVDRAEIFETRSGRRVGQFVARSPLEGTLGTSPSGPFQAFIESAALSEDGALALLGLNDGTAGVFRVSDGVRLNVLHPLGDRPASCWAVIRAVAWSRAGNLVLVGFSERRVGVWSADGSRFVAMLQAPAAAALVGAPFVRDTLISTVSSSDDERFVFGGAVDGTACVWDIATGEAVFNAVDHAEGALSVFDGPAGTGWTTTAGTVWTGDPPRKVLSTGEHWAETTVHRDRVLARGTGGEVSLWSLEGRRQELAGRSESAMGWATRARTLLLTDEEVVYPRGGRRVVVRRRGGEAELTREKQLVRIAIGGDLILTAGWEEVAWWSLAGRLIHRLAFPSGDGAVAVSPDGSRIAIGELGSGGGSYRRSVRIYEASTGAERTALAGHDWQVSQVAFSPDGQLLASLAEEVLAWDLTCSPPRLAFRVELRKPRTMSALQFLADGSLLVLDEDRARVIRRGVEVSSWVAPIGLHTRWCLSADERTLIVAIPRGLARLDLATGATRRLVASIPAPSRFPSLALHEELGARSACATWRTPFGVFVHQSDGPRGWVQPMSLGAAGCIAVPTRSGAAIVRVAPSEAVVHQVAFSGKLRASRVSAARVVLVNEEGRVFQSRLAGHFAATGPAHR